jgi:tRNA (mo5U34)-methyltransferase
MQLPVLPTAPPGFDLQCLLGNTPWHQRWEVFPGVFTPGVNPVATICDRIGLPGDLTGQRVLDVGAWHGCFSFECERRGAAEVVALSLEDPDAVGFMRLKAVLDSQVRYVRGSVYTLDRGELGEFDVVLFLGVLYHLRHPLLAIDRLRTVSRGIALIETHVIDKQGTLPADLLRVPIWRFYPHDELNADPSNWFGPNCQAVLDAFDSAGFRTLLLDQWDDRAAFCAQPAAPLALSLRETYEAWEGNRA